MPGRDPILALLVGLTLVGSLTSHAQQISRGAGESDAEIVDATLSISRTIELAPITMAEVFGLGAGLAAPRAMSDGADSSAHAAGTAVSLGSWKGTTPTDVFPEAPTVRRTVDDAWLLRIARGQEDAYFDVDYQLHGLNGRANALSHASDPGSEITVRVDPITPTIVGADGDDELLQGGVTFYLELGSISRSGSYRGTLTVTFNNY